MDVLEDRESLGALAAPRDIRRQVRSRGQRARVVVVAMPRVEGARALELRLRTLEIAELMKDRAEDVAQRRLDHGRRLPPIEPFLRRGEQVARRRRPALRLDRRGRKQGVAKRGDRRRREIALLALGRRGTQRANRRNRADGRRGREDDE
jgi:hypothetical protein